MTSISRRQFVQAGSATSLAALAGMPVVARARSAVTLRFSSSMQANENAAHYVWYQHFQANLKAAVSDQIKIDYFPDSQLGKESDVVQQVKVGSIDMMVSGSAIFATIVPEFGMLDLGYLFDSDAHEAKVLDGTVGTMLNKMLQQRSGITVLAWASSFGARDVFTKKPVRTLAELKGLKLRVLPAPTYIETFKLMGAVPTPLPFGELYMATQTGVVDGFEHDPATVLASKLYEVVKYCWLTQHEFAPMAVVIGKRGMDKIPANLRAAFIKAVGDANQQERTIANEKATAAIAELKRDGMTFFPMSATDRNAVRNTMETQEWPRFAKQYPATAPLFTAINAARV